jgi:dUTP pyrophosphatase
MSKTAGEKHGCKNCKCNISTDNKLPEKMVWFTRIHPDACLPEYKSIGSACADLYLPEDVLLYPQSVKKVPLGLVAKVDSNYHLKIYIRSSIAKEGIMLANGVGIIDTDYCGPKDELALLLYNTTLRDVEFFKGHRIAQFEVAPNIRFPILEAEFHEKMAKRSRGGFGSTGK